MESGSKDGQEGMWSVFQSEFDVNINLWNNKSAKDISRIYFVTVGNICKSVQQQENLLDTIKKGIADLTKTSAFKIYDGAGSSSHKRNDKSN